MISQEILRYENFTRARTRVQMITFIYAIKDQYA